MTTTAELGLSSTIQLDKKKQSKNTDVSPSSTTTTTTTTTTNPKRATVNIIRQHVPPLNLNPVVSRSGPSAARSTSPIDVSPCTARY